MQKRCMLHVGTVLLLPLTIWQVTWRKQCENQQRSRGPVQERAGKKCTSIRSQRLQQVLLIKLKTRRSQALWIRTESCWIITQLCFRFSNNWPFGTETLTSLRWTLHFNEDCKSLWDAGDVGPSSTLTCSCQVILRVPVKADVTGQSGGGMIERGRVPLEARAARCQKKGFAVTSLLPAGGRRATAGYQNENKTVVKVLLLLHRVERTAENVDFRV